MTYLKTDDESYMKDGSSGAVLNTNNAAYLAFKQQRQASKSNAKLRQDVDELKGEITEIKEILKMIAERVR